MPSINVMIKPASGLCNMRCDYCFYADEMNKRSQASYGMMSLNTLENIIRKTLEYATNSCTIAYQGGEPTLAGLDFFKKSIEFQKKYNVNHVTIQNALQTNGYCLDDEWCKFFYDNHFLIGLSIDGIKATHDCYRKDAEHAQTFFRITQSADLLKKHKVDFNILTVIHSKTAPKIRRIYENYKKSGYHYLQFIACLEPFLEERGIKDFVLTPKVYGQFLIDLFELWEIDLKQGTQPYIRQFENWIGVLMGILPESCEQRGFCSAQTIIEADGSVYPCDFYVMDHFCLGNLNINSYEEILSSEILEEFLLEGQKHPAQCKQCRYFGICRGGCKRQRTLTADQSDHSLNYFCEAYQIFFDKCYDRMCVIARQIRQNKR